MNSLVLCTAYLSLLSGSTIPIQAFGLLAAVAMFLALVGDLLIFPALILLFRPTMGLDEYWAKKNASAF